nr:MAG TPA: hypothetical protein [Caudoviricetes sp.]
MLTTQTAQNANFGVNQKKEYKNTPAVKKSIRWGNKWKPLLNIQ